MVKIKDIPVNDRPRERLITKGSNSLSNEELLAILIKTGTKSKSAKDIANLILSKISNIRQMQELTYEELKDINGIGISKATTILALIELSKRMNNNIEILNNVKFNHPSIIYEYYKNSLGEEKQEYFYCIYLDNSKIIIKEKLLYIGTINQTLIHPRDIFKEAYKLSATSIVCVHNHPSGDLVPSKNDIEMTKNLVNVGKLMGIEITDHIIVSKNNYYSFFENGKI